jgi:rubrerythrin
MVGRMPVSRLEIDSNEGRRNVRVNLCVRPSDCHEFIFERGHAVIETREDLIRALQEASEIEQGLMIQYLFGAFSLKRSERENLTPGQGALVRDWKARILGVAQEEMGHLGTVCNLLSAIGAPPHFSRPNFPKATS